MNACGDMHNGGSTSYDPSCYACRRANRLPSIETMDKRALTHEDAYKLAGDFIQSENERLSGKQFDGQTVGRLAKLLQGNMNHKAPTKAQTP